MTAGSAVEEGPLCPGLARLITSCVTLSKGGLAHWGLWGPEADMTRQALMGA